VHVILEMKIMLLPYIANSAKLGGSDRLLEKFGRTATKLCGCGRVETRSSWMS